MSRFDGVHDLDDVRECLSRLSFAFTDLLGNQPTGYWPLGDWASWPG